MKTNNPSIPLKEIDFDDFEISWVGPYFGEELCFGSEDGRIRIAKLCGLSAAKTWQATETDDPINGAVFRKNGWMATNRSEVVLRMDRDGSTISVNFDGGAHGALKTDSGRLVALLGHDGLLVSQPETSDSTDLKIAESPEGRFNFYQAFSLGKVGAWEVLVAATRESGIAVVGIDIAGDIGGIRSIEIGDADLVDVAGLFSDSAPYAAVGVGLDGSLHFFRDLLRDPRPLTVRYGGIQGVAYKVFSIRGDIVVLTSQGLYRLIGLAKKFVQGELKKEKTKVGTLPFEASDGNYIYDRWLAITLVDRVNLFDCWSWNGETSKSTNGHSKEDWPNETEGESVLDFDSKFKEFQFGDMAFAN